MENNTYTNRNPCLGCQDSWSADANTSCHDFCEDYQLYLDRQKLINYNNKIKLKIDAEISETFKQNLDKLREEFMEFRKDLSNDEIVIVYNLIEFLKEQC